MLKKGTVDLFKWIMVQSSNVLCLVSGIYGTWALGLGAGCSTGVSSDRLRAIICANPKNWDSSCCRLFCANSSKVATLIGTLANWAND